MEEKLLQYLKEHEGEWFKKVDLYVYSDSEGYSPESCGRYLRYLVEKGKIKVDYYNGKFAKHLSKYSYNPITYDKRPKIVELENGERVAVLEGIDKLF
jgi:hypothetical protein